MCKLGIKPFCYFIALRVPAQLHNTKFQYQKNNRQTTTTTTTTFNPRKKKKKKSSTRLVSSATCILFLHSIPSEIMVSITSLIDMFFLTTATNVIFGPHLPPFRFPQLKSTHHFLLMH